MGRDKRTDNALSLQEGIQTLAEAMLSGRLDERADPSRFTEADGQVMALVNRMLDSLVTPLRVAGGAIAEIAHGRLPPFVIDDYNGEFADIKRNLNTFLAILYGIHNETQNLIDAIHSGRLRTRGNDWDYEGVWSDLLRGLNGALDAVIGPVEDASGVLGRLADYDLTARMHGRYRGDHAVIQRAINSTAGSLEKAIDQVAGAVDLVAQAGESIRHSSEIVARGADEQQQQLTATAGHLAQIAVNSQQSVGHTREAQSRAQESVAAVDTAKTAMDKLLAAMDQIRSSAGNTTTIIQQIDAIAAETGALSASAAEKAGKVRSSAGGFGAVAAEIRTVSRRCEEAVAQLNGFADKLDAATAHPESDAATRLPQELASHIGNLANVVMLSRMLGVNAAIEAAHVDGSGSDFETLTEGIRDLARRSAEAAKETGVLVQSSVQVAEEGAGVSQGIAVQLDGAVTGVRAIRSLTEEIARKSEEEASGLDAVSRSVAQIAEVTQANATSASDSAAAAQQLDQQVQTLTTLVSRFSYERAAAAVGVGRAGPMNPARDGG